MRELLKAIPTFYQGTQFRSRLEARWAAFFDLAGWSWEYEPLDFNGWIPDFRLCGTTPAFCEVKPVDFSRLLVPAGLDIDSVFPKTIRVANEFARSSSPFNESMSFPLDHEIILLGLGPWYPRGGAAFLGVMLREASCWEELVDQVSLDFAQLYRGTKTALDYAASLGSYQYRIGGEYDGDHHLIGIDSDFTINLWRAAGNMVQWQADGPLRRIAHYL